MRDDSRPEPDAVIYVVVSDPARPEEDWDRWDEGSFATRAEAERYREEMLDRIEREGLKRSEWEPCIWIEERERSD